MPLHIRAGPACWWDGNSVTVRIFNMDCRAGLTVLADKSVHCVVTSPPYLGLRDYGTATWEGGAPGCDHLPPDEGGGTPKQTAGRRAHAGRFAGKVCWKCGAHRVDGQMGLEASPREFVAALVGLFREVRRVLRDDGIVWLNLGDSYAGTGGQGAQSGAMQKGRARQRETVTTAARVRGDNLKPKDLCGIPWRVAFALQDDGWYLRQDVVWSKPNPMPESVDDRCTKSHEYLFLLTKNADYFFDQDAITEPIAAASVARLSQNLDEQVGSVKANGGVRADRPFKAAARRSGNLERKPPASRGCPEGGPGNQSGSVPWEGTMRNRRSVWEVATMPFQGEYCGACRHYFEGETLAALLVEKIDMADGSQRRRRHCSCGRHDAWVAHFATFPPDLIVPCVKAGASEHGACADCGAPWERITDKRLVPTYKVSHGTLVDGRASRAAGDNDQGSNRVLDGHVPGLAKQVTTLGFQPTCGCGQTSTVPCTVLDPFGGAGITGLVADRLGRDAILFELNPDYADMARQRIAGDGGMFARVEIVDTQNSIAEVA